MKSTFKSYDELPLILTVADISGILGMSLNNCYNLIKETLNKSSNSFQNMV